MIKINILDTGADRYSLKINTDILGHMYDNGSEYFSIYIPASEESSICTMILTHEDKIVDHITLVEGETIYVDSNMSQYKDLCIGFCFTKSDGYIKSSSVQKFKFLYAQKPDGFVPIEPSQRTSIDYLINYGFTNSQLDGNTLKFFNMNGVLVCSFDLSPFIQAQSNLAETNPENETFVQNKSTKYLLNEGEDGSSPYTTENKVSVIVERIDQDIATEIVNREQADSDLSEDTKDATRITEGTLDDARLSENVAMRNEENTFNENQSFSKNIFQSVGGITYLNNLYNRNNKIYTRYGETLGLSAGELTGIQAILYNGTNDGILGFNSIGEARVGNINATKPLAERDESINLINGQVMIWNSVSNKLIGSSNFVTFENYSSNINSGVVKTSSIYGASTDQSDGFLKVEKATNTEINAQTDEYKSIVPSNLKYAVESVVGDQTTLSTDAKKLVGAVNELKGLIPSIVSNTSNLLFPSYDTNGYITGSVKQVYNKEFSINGVSRNILTDVDSNLKSIYAAENPGTLDGQVMSWDGESGLPIWKSPTPILIVQDNLNYNSPTEINVLSAYQGYVLNNTKLSISDILNSNSSATDKPYSASYSDSKYAPKTYFSNLYVTKLSDITASLLATKPTDSVTNYLTSTRTNTDFDFVTPTYTLSRTIESATNINKDLAMSIILNCAFDRSEIITYAIGIDRIRNEIIETIGSNQLFTKNYVTSLTDFSEVSEFYMDVLPDLLEQEDILEVGDKLVYRIYGKQSSSTPITERIYTGYLVNNVSVNSYVRLNVTAVSISTGQIEDGAITHDKLSSSVQEIIDNSVLYTSQVKTTEEKSQARSNIGAKEDFEENTAFNKNFDTSVINIKMNGVISLGSLDTLARIDHIHPVDTSLIPKVLSAVEDNIASFNTDGSVKDSGYSITYITELSNSKADKVLEATLNNFSSLNSSGNLLDSGYSAGSFVQITRTINGYDLSSDRTLTQDDIGNGATYVQTENNLSDTLKSNYDIAYTNTHTHSNKLLLDAYTQSETDLASAVSLKHSHSNKTVLDNTTASYTTDEQTKLLGIAGGAQVNIIEEIKVNNTALIPTAKSVNITIPVQASDVNALPDTTKYGATIDLSYTANTGVLGLVLKDQDGTQISSDSVDLPLELLIESGSVKTCTVIDTPVAGYVVGDKYIDLVLANSNHIYIKVSDLIDQITIIETGTGNAVTDISISGNTITETKGKTFVETNRTVNGHALSSDINITKSDVGLGNVYNPTAYGGISYGGGAGESGVSFTDVDILVYTGFYTCFGTTANVPSSSYSWYIQHINSNVGNVSATQIAIAYATTTIIYIRHKISSTWGAWENISPSLKLDKTTSGSLRRVYGVNASNEQELTEIENTPTASSTKLVTSGGIKTALNTKATFVSFGSISISSGDWGSGGIDVYKKIVSVPGVLSTDKLDIDLDMEAVYGKFEVDARLTAWSKIYRAESVDGRIDFYATEIPETTIKVNIKVVR